MILDRPLRLCWLDLEMTGLNPVDNVIVEVAAVVTGADFVPLGSVEHVVWQPPAALSAMEPVVQQMHTENGLLKDIPQKGIPLRDAERAVMDLLRRHMGPGEGILCGNSIHTDRLFLARHMPMVERYLHYQHLDATSVRLMLAAHASAWQPPAPPPSRSHRAMDDIRASMLEMSFFRDQLRAAAARPS